MNYNHTPFTRTLNIFTYFAGVTNVLSCVSLKSFDVSVRQGHVGREGGRVEGREVIKDQFNLGNNEVI